jgi:hypothetical protein
LGTDTLNESAGGVDTLDFSGTTSTAVTVNLGNAASAVSLQGPGVDGLEFDAGVVDLHLPIDSALC